MLRVATTLAKSGQAIPDPAIVDGSRESLTLYSLSNTSASNPAPVARHVHARHRSRTVTEERCTSTASAAASGPSAAARSPPRNLGGNVADPDRRDRPALHLLHSTGAPILIGAGNLTAAQRATVASIRIYVSVQAPGSQHQAGGHQQHRRAPQPRIGHPLVTSLRSLARSLRTRDDGVALPTVFGLGLVMLIFVGGAMTVRRAASSRPTPTRTSTARSRPPTPASRSTRAGSRTTRTTRSTATRRRRSASRAPAAVSLPTGANANPAFGIGTTGTWANIPDDPSTRHRRAVARLVPLRGQQQATTQTRASCTCAHRSRRRRDPLDRRRPQAGRLHRLPVLHELRDHRPRVLGERRRRLHARTLRALRLRGAPSRARD